jgi:hypothetical protein
MKGKVVCLGTVPRRCIGKAVYFLDLTAGWKQVVYFVPQPTLAMGEEPLVLIG